MPCWVAATFPTSTHDWKPTDSLDGIRNGSGQCLVLQLCQRRAVSLSSKGRQQGDGRVRAMCQGVMAEALAREALANRSGLHFRRTAVSTTRGASRFPSARSASKIPCRSLRTCPPMIGFASSMLGCCPISASSPRATVRTRSPRSITRSRTSDATSLRRICSMCPRLTCSGMGHTTTRS